MMTSQCHSKLQIQLHHQLVRPGQLQGGGMLTEWGDQTGHLIMRRWNPPILRVITRLVLREIRLISNQGGHKTYFLHTSGKVFLFK